MEPTEPGFYWGRLQPWCGQTSSELGGAERWEPVAVHNVRGGYEILLLGSDEWFELDDVELGERLVHGG